MKASSLFAGQTFLARHSLRMDMIDNRPDYKLAMDQIQGTIGDIASMRLMQACLPLFASMQRLENLMGVIANEARVSYVDTSPHCNGSGGA